MKLLFTSLVCMLTISLHAQTTLFSENFESGTSGGFTLNTSDVGSMPAATNFWTVNNAYTGGSGTVVCFGFPLGYTIANTPNEPAGIFNFPNSYYMHTMSQYGQADGIFCSSFAASDAFCIFDDFIFSRMTADISTVGYTSVDFSFWWVCAAAAPQIHGQVYYSTDMGASWTQCTTPITQYANQLTWTQTTINLPAFANQATLRFGFRFQNMSGASSALDPGFSIDDISIVGSSGGGPTITTGSITGDPFCSGDSIMVPYTITGTFTGGNVFTAELSDGAGSFASPTTIGSIASISAGSVPCLIPVGTTTSTGYLVRVISSTPAVTGSSSPAIAINALPTATAGNTGPYCEGNTISLSSGGGTDFDWVGPNAYVQNNMQNPSIPSSTVAMSGVYTVTVTNAIGCSSVSTTTVSVVDCSGIENQELDQTSLYPNPATDNFTISIHENMVNECSIALVNMVGETVYASIPSQQKLTLNKDVLGLRSGIYLVKINYMNSNKVIKVIVR